jgi:Bacterial type II secretion system protein F domain.
VGRMRRIGPPRPLKYVAFVPVSGISSLLIFYYIFKKLFPTQFPVFTSFSNIPVPSNIITIIYVDLFLVFLMLPYAIYSRKYSNYMLELKRQARSFLEIYPSVAASLPSVSQAILASVDLVDPPLKDYLSAFAYLYKMTGDLEGSFLKTFSSSPRDVRLLLTSILTTARSGGRASDILNVTSRYAAELQRMEFYLKNRLQSYSSVIILGIAVYGFAVGMTIVMLEVLKKNATFGLTGVMTTSINIPGILGIFFYSLLIVSATSGYIIAKVISDFAPRTSEYFIYLILTGTFTMTIALSLASRVVT